MRDSYGTPVNQVRTVEAAVAELDDEYDEDDDLDEDEIKGFETMRMLANIALGDDESKKTLYDTPCDTWGVIMYIVTKDVGDLALGDISGAHIIRLTFGFVSMLGNLFLQFILLFYTFQYVVNPQVASLQRHYQLFHAQCFDVNGVFNQSAWEHDFAHKEELCHAGMSQLAFVSCILFLWTLAMLAEFRENLRLHRHVGQIPDLPPGVTYADQVVEKDDAAQMELYLVALSPLTRGLLYGFIIIPKYIIIAALFFIGLRWLAATESFEDLILNSLALQFIVTIDDLIFVSVFPETMNMRVQALKLAVPVQEFANEEEEAAEKKKATVTNYLRSTLILFAALGFLLVYIMKFQRVLPDFADDLSSHCHTYVMQRNAPPCGGLFGLSGAECFPYGGSYGITNAGVAHGHPHGHGHKR